jgi:hypothetical protein
LQQSGATLSSQYQTLRNEFGLTTRAFNQLNNANNRAAQEQRNGIETIIARSKALGGQLTQISFGYNNIVFALQNILAAARPVYDFLIGSNERLNQQILSSQTNLASATRIFQGGIELTDQTDKINASRRAITAALKQVEEDTRQLVGVTSSQVNELFQITLTNAASLNNQSQQFPGPIEAATQLTKGWAAALQVVGVPLDQARQEINSILKGQVDQNSILAKNLDITNTQVNTWRSQGRLVDELNKRLGVFVAGNAIAARSISGISSNILDLIQVLGREAGQPLLAPVINALAELEKFLSANREQIVQFFADFVEGAVKTGEELGRELLPALDSVVKVLGELQPLVTNLTDAFQEFQRLTGGAFTQLLSDIVKLQTLVFNTIGKLLEGLNAINDFVNIPGIKQSESDLAALQKKTDEFGQSAANTAKELQALNSATGDQSAEQERLSKAAGETIKSIDDQIKALKDYNPVGEENRKNRDAQIKSLNEQKDALQAASGEIRIEAKELENLGTAYEQLEKKANDARRAIDQATSADEANKAAKELIGVLGQQVELGQLSAEQAQASLEEVTRNSELEVGVQLQAQKQITQLRKQELDKQIGNLNTQISQAQAAEASGAKDQIETAKEVTRLRKEQLDLRLQDVFEAIAAEEAAISRGVGSQTRLDALKEEEKQLTAEKIKLQADGLAQLRDLEIKEVQKRQDDALQLIEESEQERLIALQQGLNAGTLRQEDAESERLQITRDRLQAELEAARQQQEELAKISTQGLSADAVRKIEQDKQAARAETTRITLELLQNEQQAQEQLRQRAIDAINREFAAKERAFDAELSALRTIGAQRERNASITEQALQREQRAIDAATNAIGRQNSLLQARAGLAAAQSGLETTETNIAIDRIRRAEELNRKLQEGNLTRQETQAIERVLGELGFRTGQDQLKFVRQRQALEEKLAQQKLEALNAEQELQRRQFELEARRNELANQRAITEAKINLLKAEQAKLSAQQAIEEQRIADARAIATAQAELQRAQQQPQGGQRDAAIANAQASLRLAQEAAARNEVAAQTQTELAAQQAEFAAQALGEAEQNAQLQSEITALTQQTLTLQQEAARVQLDAALAAERQARALELAAAASAKISANSGGRTIEPRFRGGPVSPGELYTMAEKGPELIKFANGKSALVNEPGLYQVPSRGHVVNAQRTRKMLAKTQPNQIPNTDRVLVQELRRTRHAIESRKPGPAANITVASGDDREVDKLMRSIIRGRW